MNEFEKHLEQELMVRVKKVVEMVEREIELEKFNSPVAMSKMEVMKLVKEMLEEMI